MTFIVGETGNCKLIQGDSGVLPLTHLPTDQNYKIGVTFYDVNGDAVTDEIFEYNNKQDAVMFKIPSQITNLLTVSLLQQYAHYHYIVRAYDESDVMQVLYFKGKDDTDQNILIVYPRKVEGDL